MENINLEMFTHGGADFETSQYNVLARVQKTVREFHHNRLYPGLSELIELTSVIETIMANKGSYDTRLPRTLKNVDLVKKTLTFDTVDADPHAVAQTFELMQWALPILKTTTDEGIAMFEFVTQSFAVGEIGVIPLYRDRGYAFIPDHLAKTMHILRYEMSLFTAENDSYRALKTTELDSMPMGILQTPEEMKLELMKLYTTESNPATYLIETDLDFPFAETLMPVAKRKLMRHLIS